MEALLNKVARQLDLGRDFDFEEFGSGISNRTVLLRAPRGTVLVRQWNEDRTGDVLPRELEVSLWRAAAARGIAPDILWADLDIGVVVSEYLHGARAWTAGDCKQPDNWRRLKLLLERFNGIGHPLPAFSPSQVAGRYLAAASHSASAAMEGPWGDELTRLSADYERAFPASGVCHHDLVPANILEIGNGEGGLKLIDFEYCARGNPIFDWATLAAFARFEPKQLDGLRQAVASNVSLLQLDQVVRLVRLLSFFWARNELASQPGRRDLVMLRDDLREALAS